MPQLLLMVHSENASVGTTTEWCAQHSVSFEIFNARNFGHARPPEGVSGLIIFGGDVETWETEKHPWLMAEKSFIADHLRAGTKIFGICLGAQLLAEQLGSPTKPSPSWEIGWHPVDLNVADGVKLTPLHWHASRFALPPQTELLASNEDTYCQGFRARGGRVGYQFHTEINRERLETALSSWSPSLIGKVQSVEEIRVLSERYMAALKNWYFEELRRWWAAA